MKKLAWTLTALVLAAVVASPAAAQFGGRFNTVRGDVHWSGPPPVDSTLQIFVFDLTDPAYPQIIADQAIRNPMGSPVPFQIAIDPRRISPNRTYGVTARMIYGNPPSIAFENRQPHYVLTRGNPNTVSVRLNNLISNDPGRPGRPGQGFRRGRIVGTVSFRDRAVPNGAILQVFLFDLTDPRAPYIVADEAINNPQGNSARFRLRFDRSQIDPSRRYGVTARIIYGSPPSVLLQTRRPVFVLTRGNADDDGEIELQLRRVI
jgi:uncharacterized lipoprotein YbaY